MIEFAIAARNRTITGKGITLEVKKGKIFGFLGPNGAGKTTTLQMLTTLLTPTSGTASTPPTVLTRSMATPPAESSSAATFRRPIRLPSVATRSASPATTLFADRPA